MKLMGEARQTNMAFYDLVNLLGTFAVRITLEARTFAMGLVSMRLKKKSITFEAQLNTAQNNLRNGDISPIQFLNALTTSKHNNRLVDESWGLNHSRIDVLPEIEDSDEDVDSPGSECVNSDTDDDV